MGIRFRCHHCEHELNLKDFQAGRRARCPACSGRFRVPTTSRDFSTPLEDDEQELASTSLQIDGPNAGRDEVAPSFNLKQPTGDLERFKSPSQEIKRSEAPASAAAASSGSNARAKAVQKRATPRNKPRAKRIPPDTAATSALATQHADATRTNATQVNAAQDNASRTSPAVAPVHATSSESIATGQAAPAARTLAVPRAIAEAPQAVWYVRPPSGGQFGPADSATFYQWMAENRVARESLVWRDGWPQWMIAADAFEEYYGTRWLVPETTGAAAEPAVTPTAVGTMQAATADPAPVSGTAVTANTDNTAIANTARVVEPSSIAGGGQLAVDPAVAGVGGGVTPVRSLGKRKRRKPNYALGITVLAIVAIVLVAVLIVVLMQQ